MQRRRTTIPRLERPQSASTSESARSASPRVRSAPAYYEESISVNDMGSKKIDKKHEKYAFMYHMLTGIRLSVSRTDGNIDRSLTPDDYKAVHKLASDVTGAELEPKQRYDFKFKDYCPFVFRKIREAFGLTARKYLGSLTGRYILSELFSPGKSKAYLYYSHDFRYIIKNISRAEKKKLLEMLPAYLDHVSKNPNTLLAKYLGLHRVKTQKKSAVHFVVMTNVHPSHLDMHEIYDLKGSTLGRISEPGKKVLKDLNWIQNNRKLFLGHRCNLFLDQLEHDVEFLAANNIMDYSLLIGIHDLELGNSMETAVSKDKHLVARLNTISDLHLGQTDSACRSIFSMEEGGFRSFDKEQNALKEIYFLCIIDILTPYNTKKKFEHFAKSIAGDSHAISAVPPQEYSVRFAEFMKKLTE